MHKEIIKNSHRLNYDKMSTEGMIVGAEVMPEPEGGMDEIYRYLAKNL